MSLDSMRGTYGRCPPFLVAGLLVVCIILTFNWWSLSSQNYDLIRQIEELGEQLKISSEEQELCVQQRLSAEQRLKTMEEEMAQLRIQEEREREELTKTRNSLSTQEEEVKKIKKLYDEIKKSANMCNTELESLNKVEISKDSVIASLRLENKKYETELKEKNQELQQAQNELNQAQVALQAAVKTERAASVGVLKAIGAKSSTVSPQKPAAADDGMLVGGNHEQEGENEENNAGERGDGDVNLEEGGGDNVLDDPAQHFDENRP